MKSLVDVVNELRVYDAEREWFEFKENWFEAKALGEYISALSNSAAYEGKEMAYFVWGINDDTHEVVGTHFNPNQKQFQQHMQRNDLYILALVRKSYANIRKRNLFYLQF